MSSSADRECSHSPQLGILSSRPPILITTLRPCPRGTNGGVSVWGTLVSLLGGILVSALAVISLALQGQAAACGGRGRYGSSWWWAMELLLLGGLSGLGGSMVRVARAISLYETTHTGYETNRDHHDSARNCRSTLSSVASSNPRTSPRPARSSCTLRSRRARTRTTRLFASPGPAGTSCRIIP